MTRALMPVILLEYAYLHQSPCNCAGIPRTFGTNGTDEAVAAWSPEGMHRGRLG
ncbi:hypothetical protein FA13DRAFT_1735455 [Coprinellus micaceus]|uniref:Uncharacterized protein n=1 Tax=Coprinellus micaceus TaxID=71717 RepID=A0A4Y7T387_COPMI|nr:hypothetical protein FA13DRAFT_1735455 [Coprinellus micaceus]